MRRDALGPREVERAVKRDVEVLNTRGRKGRARRGDDRTLRAGYGSVDELEANAGQGRSVL